MRPENSSISASVPSPKKVVFASAISDSERIRVRSADESWFQADRVTHAGRTLQRR
jgi:hypothetical protein